MPPLLALGSSHLHAKNIFSTTLTAAGHALFEGTCTENFLAYAVNPPIPLNPILDGSHFVNGTYSLVRFMTTYYSPTLYAPSSIAVVINQQSYSLTLQLGVATRGSYFRDFPTSIASPGCVPYYFKVTNAQGTFILPENGTYYIDGLGTCTTNWNLPVSQRTTLSPTASPPATFNFAITKAGYYCNQYPLAKSTETTLQGCANFCGAQNLLFFDTTTRAEGIYVGANANCECYNNPCLASLLVAESTFSYGFINGNTVAPTRQPTFLTTSPTRSPTAPTVTPTQAPTLADFYYNVGPVASLRFHY